MMTDFLKEVGTTEVARDSLNIKCIPLCHIERFAVWENN